MDIIKVVQSIEPETLFDKICNEEIELITKIILCMNYSKRNEIFDKLKLNSQVKAIKIIINTKEIKYDELNIIYEILTGDKNNNINNENILLTEGIHTVVGILNYTKKEKFNKIMKYFYDNDSILADEILKNMIVLEDIVMVNNEYIKMGIKDIDNQILAIAIKGLFDEKFYEYFYKNLSDKKLKIIKKMVEEMSTPNKYEKKEAQFIVYKSIQNCILEENTKNVQTSHNKQ